MNAPARPPANTCPLFPSIRQVEVVSEGDSVNELFIVLSGSLSSYRVSSLWNPEVRGGVGWVGGWEGGCAQYGRTGHAIISTHTYPPPPSHARTWYWT